MKDGVNVNTNGSNIKVGRVIVTFLQIISFIGLIVVIYFLYKDAASCQSSSCYGNIGSGFVIFIGIYNCLYN